MTSSHLGLPALYLSIFLLALTGLFAKLIPLDATSIIQLRSLVAAVGLASFMAVQRRGVSLIGFRAYIGVYTLGILLGLHWVTFFHAMQVSSVAVGMLAMFTFPVITILLEPVFSGRKITVGDLVAGLLVLAGLGIMVGPSLTDLRQPVTLGVLFGVFSALLFALRNLLQKYLYAGESSDGLILHQVIAIALMLIPFVDYPQVQVLKGAGIVNILLLGLLSTAAGHTLLTYSLKQLPAKSVALIQCLQPPIAALLAWWVIGETPDVAVLIGGGMILSVSVYESLRQKR